MKMISSTRIVRGFGLLSILFVPQLAAASIWSVRADCGDGDWTVEVELAGFGVLDASCVDGAKTHVEVDVGDLIVTHGSIEATSSSGATCDNAAVGDSKFKLECAHKVEYGDGFELEEEVEVEVEVEEDEGDEDE
jgi:hypothetical protein